MGELIITKNRLDTILGERSGPTGKQLKAALATMDRLVNEMQEDVSAARLVPVDEIFQKFPRMVRDLALEQHKEIDLILEGRQIELDKAVLDAISEPLVHLLRNAVDHGIEPPEERQRRAQAPARHHQAGRQTGGKPHPDRGGGRRRRHRSRRGQGGGGGQGVITPDEAEALPETKP